MVLAQMSLDEIAKHLNNARSPNKLLAELVKQIFTSRL